MFQQHECRADAIRHAEDFFWLICRSVPILISIQFVGPPWCRSLRRQFLPTIQY